MKRTWSICVLVLTVFGLSNLLYAKPDPNPDTLRVALLPDEDAATVIKDNKPLQAYLEKTIGRKIELIVTTDYSSMIEAMRHGRLELGYFGPLSYVMAAQKSDIEAFAAREKKGNKTYQAVVIANKKSGVQSMADIKGKNMAYGDPASTSSHLIPKSMLKNEGLEHGKDYKEHFLGAHDAVAVTVQSGRADAGGLSRPIFESLLKKGIIDAEKVTVLGYSSPFPQYPWALRSNLDDDLKKKIKDAFHGLQKDDVLKPFKATGFAVMTDKDYDVVRDLAKILNLDLAKM